MDASAATTLRRVLRQFNGPTPVQNTPRADLAVALYERVEEPAVVVLDEADSVHETVALDRLLDVDALAVVVVVHDPDRFLAAIDERVRTAFPTPALRVEKFALDELVDILAGGLVTDPARHQKLHSRVDYHQVVQDSFLPRDPDTPEYSNLVINRATSGSRQACLSGWVARTPGNLTY